MRALNTKVHYCDECTSCGFDGSDRTVTAYASVGGKLGGCCAGFQDGERPRAFEFLDPALVIRSAYLEPAFALGRPLQASQVKATKVGHSIMLMYEYFTLYLLS